MTKITYYLLALSLVALSSINRVEAGRFSKCTAALAKKGGPEAHKCVFMSDPAEDPNFFKSFIHSHCQKPIHPDHKRSCTIAKNKSAETLTAEHVNTRHDDEEEEE